MLSVVHSRVRSPWINHTDPIDLFLVIFPHQNNGWRCVVQSVDGEHHEKAVELLKAAQGSVKLVVRYTPKVLEEMEARFEKMRSARRRQQHTSYS